ncbi:MAG: CoA transferase [Chloroflexi bacterium]|nr:CoA transferase [Chloroflexota bacterium]
MTAALEGVRVLEVSGGAALPPSGAVALAYGGALLAGLGAQVTKLEPVAGDWGRRSGPFPGDRPQRDHAGQFWYLNASKRSAALDLGTATGRALLGRMIARCDLVLHDAAPADAATVGLHPESIAEANADVVQVAVTPFGQAGPYRDWLATDLEQQALSGLLDLTGEPDREPLRIGAPVSEYAAGQIAALSALTALHAARESGEGGGEVVDVAVLEAAASIMEHSMAIYQYRGIVRRRSGNWGGLSAWGIYPCKDGFVGVVSGLGETYQRFRRLIGGVLLEEGFETIVARTQLASEMDAAIMAWLSDKTKDEVFHAAQREKIPFSALATSADVAMSAQLQARGYLEPQRMPDHEGVVMPGAPFLIDGDSWRREPAPRLGEHTSEVLGELGLEKRTILRLVRAGVAR